MSDDLGLFGPDDADDGEPERGRGLRRKRRSMVWVSVGVVIVLLGGAVWYGLHELLGIGYADYSGSGTTDVLVHVETGDSTRAIGHTLVADGVVASAHAFTSAGDGNAKIRAIQPGYYVMKKKMSGSAAVAQITDPSSKVGAVEIRPGDRLANTKLPSGKIVPGIFSKLAKASCAKLNGKSTCVSADELRKVASKEDPAALGVPQWAVADVGRAQPGRRLEGLIAPALYQVKPGDSAERILKSVLATSAAHWEADGLPTIAKNTGFTPYQLLIIASLSQSEAIEPDFSKVARVTYNRLAANRELQYDSTINYVLDRPEIRTQPSDRAKPGPYNTYTNPGLPPTPISAPSAAAVQAAAKPAQGKWMYFVKCEKDGKSCFAATAAEHAKNVAKAQADGVY